MKNDIMVLAEYLSGKICDVSFEMLGKARELADVSGGKVYVVLLGSGANDCLHELGAADTIIRIEHEQLPGYSPQANALALFDFFAKARPWLTFVGSTSWGLDLSSTLSSRMSIPLIASVRNVALEGETLTAVCQLLGGKMMVEVALTVPQGIVSCLPGSFPAEKGRVVREIEVIDVQAGLAPEDLKMSFLGFIEPEAGDIDLTQVPVLVSVGRGIQNKDNIEMAEKLAAQLGGAVSASRPVVDQGWLPLTRQVGRSGMIVKPKLYLALGISGAPEHLEGMRDAELIIAINTDPSAPIFNTAHYGVVGDALDFVPTLTEALRNRKAVHL